MRAVTAFVYAALVAIATVALACDEAQQTRLNSSNHASALRLVETSGGETIRVCVDSDGPIDYFFTSQSAAASWMLAASFHYFLTNQPYSQPPSVVFRSKYGTTGFTEEFDITDAQADRADNNFAIIMHATSACTGIGTSCTVDVAVHIVQLASWIVIVILVAIIASIVGCIVACAYCCCCRKQPVPEPVFVQQVQVEPTVGQQMQPVAGQPVAHPQQVGTYPAQPAGYSQQQPQPQPTSYTPHSAAYPPPQQQPAVSDVKVV